MYVWFDALVNYISATGWSEDEKSFRAWWPGIQIAGKDNLRQQSAMWQAMLMSAGLPNTKQIMIHGFITSGGQKMSKSLGNVVSPYDLVGKYGTDATRYYLLAKINPFEDGDFTYAKFEEAYNSDLANGLGNLVQRVAKLCEGLEIPLNSSKLPYKPSGLFGETGDLIEKFSFNEALAKIWDAIKALDQYINQQTPWKQSASDKKQTLEKVIFGNKSSVSLIEISQSLEPFLPSTASKIQQIFKGPKISAPSTPLFPRLTIA